MLEYFTLAIIGNCQIAWDGWLSMSTVVLIKGQNSREIGLKIY